MAIQSALAVFLACFAFVPEEVNSNNQILAHETQENSSSTICSILWQNVITQKNREALHQRAVEEHERRRTNRRYKRDNLEHQNTTSEAPAREVRKKLPAGSDFRRIIERNMIYVDKTDIIYELITTKVYVFLSRPPRFGKSLLVSTLGYLFEGGPLNEELFRETKIKMNNDSNYDFPEHTVLNFDFSRLAWSTLQGFATSLRSLVKELLENHDIDEQRCVDTMEPKECLDKLLASLEKKTKKGEKKIVVLVDEYDQPWRNFEGNDADRKALLIVMRNFFMVLKSYDHAMRFCFVTGSTKIALAEFFSGYNGAKDISWLPFFGTIVGFSHSELKQNFAGYVSDRATRVGMSVDEVYQDLYEKFEGYRFSLRNESMYSSTDIIDFFENDQYGAEDFDTYQKQTDSMYVVEAIRKMPELTIGLDLFTQLNAANEDVMIPVDVDFIRGFKESFKSPKATLKVLFEGGYLSIKHYNSTGPRTSGKYYIGFTNVVAQQHYHEILETAFGEQAWSSLHQHTSMISASNPGFLEPLEERNMTSFLRRVRAHFTNVPYLLLPKKEKQVESFFQVILYYGMILSGMQTDWETILATGRLDVRATTYGTSYIFELKRKSNPEWTESMKQCDEYTHRECFRNKKIVCIGIVFEDKPTQSKRVIHAWGMFEKSADGSFLPDRNNLNMTEYDAEGEPVFPATAPEQVMKRKCDRCAKEFSNAADFIQHLKEAHNSEPEFIKTQLVCPYCWRSFGNRGGLVQHIAHKHSKSTTECEAEREPAFPATAPKQAKKRKCDRCAKEFSNAADFIQHLKEAHNSEPEFIKILLVCPYCWRSFGNRGGLIQHIAHKHSKNKTS